MQNKEKKELNKKGQVTIFIIIGILIVSVVLVFFLYIQPRLLQGDSGKLNLETCMDNAVESEIKQLGMQAGFSNQDFFYMYDGNKVSYLCYTNLYYKPCNVLKPFLVQHFSENLEKNVKQKIETCYENSINELKSKGYDVSAGNPDFKILINPGEIQVNLDAPVTLTRETSRTFTTFTTKTNSNLYDVLMVATSLLQFEAKYGDSDTSTLMIFYPDLLINKIKRGDGTTVYILTDKNSKLKFEFASRSFAWPAGYGISEGGQIE